MYSGKRQLIKNPTNTFSILNVIEKEGDVGLHPQPTSSQCQYVLLVTVVEVLWA